MQASRGADSLTSQIGRIVGGQENHHRGNFLRLSESCAEWNRSRNRIPVRASDKPDLTVAFGVDQTRGDRVDPDIPRSQLLRERQRQRVRSRPLVAEYREELGTGFWLAIELRLMMLPPVRGKCLSAC